VGGRFRVRIMLSRIFAIGLPAAVSGGLVRDLPDAVDPQQIVEVDPSTGLV
jgi:hypothetical protein